MSDVFTTRRPTIDLDEFERRLCPRCSTDQRDGDPLAELIRILGGGGQSHVSDCEPKTPLSARARQDAGEPGELNLPDAQVRLLGGDFAAIEAGLLGALREHATATVSETDMSNAFPSVAPGPERRLYQDSQPASRHARVALGQFGSRRPRYVTVAIVIVGMAGMAASFGLNSRLSGPPEIASIKAENGPDKQQTAAASNADDPARDALILGKPPGPSPMALASGTERSFDLPQTEEKTLPSESRAELDNGPAAVPAAPARAPTPAEPHGTAAPVPSDTVKTDLVRPDGTLLPNGTPPQANIQANINGAPLPAPRSLAAAKVPTAKAAGRVAKPLKPAASHPGSHRQLRQIANKAKATPVSPVTPEPLPSADPKAETPAIPPSPVANGAFGFVRSALNSLTSTTAKLFEWGRIESGSRP